jgi:hypothetical protein
MEKIRLVYVLFGISPRIWNGLRTYTEVPLYVVTVEVTSSHGFGLLAQGLPRMLSHINNS